MIFSRIKDKQESETLKDGLNVLQRTLVGSKNNGIGRYYISLLLGHPCKNWALQNQGWHEKTAEWWGKG